MGDVSPPPYPISSAQSANKRHGPSQSLLGLGTTITTTTTTTTVQDHEIDCPLSDADAGSQLNPDSPTTKPLPHVVATSSQAAAEPLKPVFAMPPPPPLLQEIPRTSVIFSTSNAMEAPDPIKKPEKGSATLVWRDVTVTTTGGGGCKRQVEVAPPTKVLKSSTGFARPGSMLSIMGSACSGKNILLKSLAGNINTRSTWCESWSSPNFWCDYPFIVFFSWKV